jgi:hypothetical protein
MCTFDLQTMSLISLDLSATTPLHGHHNKGGADDMAWGDPHLIDSLEQPFRVTPLQRQSSSRLNGQPGYREALLQRLIQTAPECLPIRAIDPAFLGLRAVCTELPLREDVGRFADNLLINADGRICLVECKLATNAEADRDVLAQLLDYAAALGRLDYDGLQDRVRRATGRTGDPISRPS